MRRFVKSGWRGALPLSVVLLVTGLSWAETKVPATIVLPRANGIVGRVTEVIVEAKTTGVPLVFVTAENETEEWWVQPPAKTTGNGRYQVAAHFGNTKTPQGKPFQVVAVIAPNERVAASMAKQQVFLRLPSGIAASKPIRVLRQLDTEKTVKHVTTSTAVTAVAPGAAMILRLEDRALVSRRQEVQGTLCGSIDPVILVRAAAPNSLWWVQDPVQRNATGQFTAIVRFGNDKTAAGSEFQMVALTPRSTSDASQFKVGDSLRELPKDASISPTTTVVLKPLETIGAE